MEFLDTEWYDHWQETPVKTQGWETGRFADQTVLLPLALVRKLAQPNRLSEIQLTDKDHLQDLLTSVKARGFDEPMVVVLDDHGRIVLKDGHHRLIVAVQLKLLKVPVRFQRSKRINTAACSMADMLPQLLGLLT